MSAVGSGEYVPVTEGGCGHGGLDRLSYLAGWNDARAGRQYGEGPDGPRVASTAEHLHWCVDCGALNVDPTEPCRAEEAPDGVVVPRDSWRLRSDFLVQPKDDAGG